MNRRLALVAATLLAGLSAGFFFTYQISVTRALAEVDDAAYVATFQAVNETVSNPWFGMVFFGSVPVIVVALAATWSSDTRARYLVVAALLLHVALLVVTGTGNVPLNDALAGYTPPFTAQEAEGARADFEAAWNDLNLIRAALSAGAFLALITATAVSLPARTEQHGAATAARA